MAFFSFPAECSDPTCVTCSAPGGDCLTCADGYILNGGLCHGIDFLKLNCSEFIRLRKMKTPMPITKSFRRGPNILHQKSYTQFIMDIGGDLLKCIDGRQWNFQICSALNSLRPRQNGRHFADDILKCIFLNENLWIPIKISLKFIPKGPIDNILALVQIMAWRRLGDKPLSEPVMVSLLTHICVTRPQWVDWTYCSALNWNIVQTYYVSCT